MKITFAGRIPIEFLPPAGDSRLARVIFPSPFAYQQTGCELELVSAHSLRSHIQEIRAWANKLEEYARELDRL